MNVCYFYFRPLYRKNELNAYIFCLFCENSSISKRCLIKYSERVNNVSCSHSICENLKNETTILFALSIYQLSSAKRVLNVSENYIDQCQAVKTRTGRHDSENLVFVGCMYVNRLFYLII